MAISSSCVWEIRVAGDPAAGGGFNASQASAGTDYSQQDAPQVTVTDAANTGNTALTSATANFTTDYVGNHVGLTSGGGTFLGTFELVAFVSSTEMTLDRNGPNASGMTMKLGGAKSFGAVGAFSTNLPYVAGNKIWVKAGTYSILVNGMGWSVDAGPALPVTVEGYTTTRGDGAPTRPLIAWAASTLSVCTASGSFHIFKNLEMDGGDGVGALSAVDCTGFQNYFVDCVFRRGGSVALVPGFDNRFERCWFHTPINTNPVLLLSSAGSTTLMFCVISDGLGNGVETRGNHYLRWCRIYGHAQDGFFQAASSLNGSTIEDSIIWDNGRDSIRLSATAETLEALHINRNIIGSQGAAGYNINHTVSDLSSTAAVSEWANTHVRCNIMYNAGLGNINQLPTPTDLTTITASPFSSDTDFDLGTNTAAATVRNARCSSTFADTAANVVSLGIGGLGLGQIPTGTAQMLDLWRELTNERNTTRISDTDVGRFYLAGGLEALNRVIHYHYTTSTDGITLVAETQEYSLPEDFVEVDWIQWNGQDLKKSSIDEWRRNGVKWRSQPSGNPQEYAIYGNKIVFLPKPSAAAVAADDNPVIRYCSTPADFNTNGPVQLGSQDYRPAVYHAVSEYFSSYPGGVGSKAQDYMQKFVDGAQAILADYARRGISK